MVCPPWSSTLGPAMEQYVGEQLHLEPLVAKERCETADERSGAGAKK